MLISHCPSCGLYYPTHSIALRNATNVTLVANKENCVRCGEWADVLDGTYDDKGGITTLISAPWATIERIRTLQGILEALAENRISEATAIEEAEKVSPDAGKVFREWLTLGFSAASLIVISAALGIQFLSYKEEKSLTEREIRAYVEEILSEHTLPSKQNYDIQKMPNSQAEKKNRKKRRAEKSQHRAERRRK